MLKKVKFINAIRGSKGFDVDSGVGCYEHLMISLQFDIMIVSVMPFNKLVRQSIND